MGAVRYDATGHAYATTRREDPHLAERIRAALGDSRPVVNVGAGTGSYEPRDCYVLAIAPRDTSDWTIASSGPIPSVSSTMPRAGPHAISA